MQDVNRPGEERTLGLIVRVADTKDQIFKALVGGCFEVLVCMHASHCIVRKFLMHALLSTQPARFDTI